MSAATLRDGGRTRARTLVARGGERTAELGLSPVPRRLLLLALPRALARRLDPSSARDLETVMELRVSGAAPAVFTLRIAGGACTVTRGAADRPRATVELAADDMIRLVTGVVGWPELLSRHRLTLSGDPFLALRFPLLFRLPAGAFIT